MTAPRTAEALATDPTRPHDVSVRNCQTHLTPKQIWWPSPRRTRGHQSAELTAATAQILVTLDGLSTFTYFTGARRSRISIPLGGDRDQDIDGNVKVG